MDEKQQIREILDNSNEMVLKYKKFPYKNEENEEQTLENVPKIVHLIADKVDDYGLLTDDMVDEFKLFLATQYNKLGTNNPKLKKGITNFFVPILLGAKQKGLLDKLKNRFMEANQDE